MFVWDDNDGEPHLTFLVSRFPVQFIRSIYMISHTTVCPMPGVNYWKQLGTIHTIFISSGLISNKSTFVIYDLDTFVVVVHYQGK